MSTTQTREEREFEARMRAMSPRDRVNALREGEVVIETDIEHLTALLKVESEMDRKPSRYDTAYGGPKLPADLVERFQGKLDRLIQARWLLQAGMRKIEETIQE